MSGRGGALDATVSLVLGSLLSVPPTITLVASTASIRVKDAIDDYGKAREFLASMAQLSCINLTLLSLTEKTAVRLTCCIPRKYKLHNVVVYVKGSEAEFFKKAEPYMKEKGVVMQR